VTVTAMPPVRLSVREYEEAARSTVDPVHHDFVAGGADDEVTVRANEEGFARLSLLPRVLRGRSSRELGLDLFGGTAALPVFLSPTAFHKLLHRDGELATARAAKAAGVVMCTGMAATTAVEEVAAVGPQLWFQLYLQPDLEFTEALVERVTRAGVSALVVTVDSAVRGAHTRDRRNGFTDLPEGLACENLRGVGGDDPAHVRPIAMSAEISWDHVDRLRRATDLPIVLKGVLHPEDARIAVRHGVDGLLLSNHGGRQLDTVPSTVDMLPEMVGAVGGRLPVFLDGGVRRGTDVVKALALGATAVGIGRPALWGLAVDGESGVRRVLDLLREELDGAMALCGAGSLRDLTPDLVRSRP
jgi:4-hydroxymandelate oxidase